MDVVTKHIALLAVRTDGETQTRPALIEASVLGCMERMQATDDLPPVEVVQEGDVYWLWDGFHREESARRLKRQTLIANVRKGALDDARWLAASANKASDPHLVGNQRNDATKRACVLLALRQRPNLSDGVIAKHVGCSRQYVSQVRAEVPTGNSCELHKEPRTCLDGKKRKAKNQPPAEGPLNDAVALVEQGLTQTEAARRTGVRQDAISREIARRGGKSATPAATPASPVASPRTKKPSGSAIQPEPCPLGLDQEERIAALLNEANRVLERVASTGDVAKLQQLVESMQRTELT